MEGKQLVQRVGRAAAYPEAAISTEPSRPPCSFQLRHGALHGSPGAGNVVLIDDGDTLIVGAGRFGDSFRLLVHDHGQRFRVERRHGVHHTVQKRLSGQSVQHFRLVERMRVPSPAARIIAALNAMSNLQFLRLSQIQTNPDTKPVIRRSILKRALPKRKTTTSRNDLWSDGMSVCVPRNDYRLIDDYGKQQ